MVCRMSWGSAALTCEKPAIWEVGAVDLRVAVGTGAVENEDRVRRSRRDRVARPHVTLLAKPGNPDLEQAVVDRAVRLVTVGAVHQDRRMGP